MWTKLQINPDSAEAPRNGRYQWQEQHQVKNVMECEADVAKCRAGMARFCLYLELVDT